MFEKVDIKDIRQITCDRLELETTNISLCAKMGKGTIKVFISFINRVIKGEPFYAFVPKEALRKDQGDWEYDISSFKIYRFKLDDLIALGFDRDIIATMDSKSMLTIPLSDEFIIYDSKEGSVVETSTVKTEFTLREKACLYLSLPESGTKWLDELIIKKNRNVLLNV
jgi:hypothetical protein